MTCKTIYTAKADKCKRCGKDIEYGEILLFRGGEYRRFYIEKMFRTKVTQCPNPPPSEYWK